MSECLSEATEIAESARRIHVRQATHLMEAELDGVGFYAAFVFAIVVNLFGAVTFDRTHKYYDRDNSQNVMFQPD